MYNLPHQFFTNNLGLRQPKSRMLQQFELPPFLFGSCEKAKEGQGGQAGAVKDRSRL
jgi:hypothetical protein